MRAYENLPLTTDMRTETMSCVIWTILHTLNIFPHNAVQYNPELPYLIAKVKKIVLLLKWNNIANSELGKAKDKETKLIQEMDRSIWCSNS